MTSTIFDDLEKYGEDQRDDHTRETHAQIVKEQSQKNFNVLSSLLPQPKDKSLKIKKSKPTDLAIIQAQKDEKNRQLNQEVIKLDLGDSGWWLTYRDSNTRLKLSEQPLDNHHVLISICGVPGSLKYYSAIEKYLNPTQIRFLNLNLPGLEGDDERRGTYNGTLDHIASIIDQFMEKLNISKATLLMHSFGGLIGKYFAGCFPHRVEGLIQLATIPITKWMGWKRYEQLEETVFNLPETLDLADLNREETRKEIYEKQLEFIDQIKQLTKQQQAPFAQLLLFSPYDYINLLKLRRSIPGGIHEILRRIRISAKQFPRMIAYAPADTLIDGPLVEEEIMHFVLGSNAVKHKIPASFAPEIANLDRNNFSSNFIFKYDDATHILHHEKAKELAELMVFFMKGIKQIDRQENQSKL